MYFFHGIYRDFLSKKSVLLSPAAISDTYFLAGSWFLENSRPLDAVEAFGRGGHHTKMLEAVKGSINLSFNNSLGRFLLKHLEALPTAFTGETPEADYLKASIYLRSLEFGKASELLESLAARLSGGGNNYVLGEAYILLAALALIDNDASFAEYYKKAFRCLPGGSNMMPENVMMIENANTILTADNTPAPLARMEQLFQEAAPYIEHVMNGGGRGLVILFSADAGLQHIPAGQGKRTGFPLAYTRTGKRAA
jgi:ATP/maltotriose-dependent transcriptional regulator MalT